MIYLRNVTKTFDDVTALDDFGMTLKKGSIYGLIGKNGAGKTTILKILSGVIKADSGEVTIDGESVYENAALKSRLSFIPDDLSFFSRYTLKEAGRFFASIYETWDQLLFERIIFEFQLNPSKNLARFSKGMQKQAVFALSLGTSPDYLFLDEPIDGLDPIVRKKVWNYIITASAERQMTTLISSHNLREMEGICDYVGIIADGKMLLEKELDELSNDVHKVQISFGTGGGFYTSDSSATPEGAYNSLNVVHAEKRGAVDILIVRNDMASLERWNDQYKPLLFDPLPLTLEEVFIYELGGANNATIEIIG